MQQPSNDVVFNKFGPLMLLSPFGLYSKGTSPMVYRWAVLVHGRRRDTGNLSGKSRDERVSGVMSNVEHREVVYSQARDHVSQYLSCRVLCWQANDMQRINIVALQTRLILLETIDHFLPPTVRKSTCFCDSRCNPKLQYADEKVFFISVGPTLIETPGFVKYVLNTNVRVSLGYSVCLFRFLLHYLFDILN